MISLIGRSGSAPTGTGADHLKSKVVEIFLHRSIRVRILNPTGRSPISGEAKTASMRPTLEAPPSYMSDQFFYLQLKFTPKIGHTFTDQREVVVEVPKDLVQRKSEAINESLREVIALGLARSAALGTFPTESERSPKVYDEAPPTWYPERHQIMNERACDYEENGTRAWRIIAKTKAIVQETEGEMEIAAIQADRLTNSQKIAIHTAIIAPVVEGIASDQVEEA
jgi:hypothetical protein